jgi:hypothetical protein
LGFHALLICGMFVPAFALCCKHLREVAGIVDIGCWFRPVHVGQHQLVHSLAFGGRHHAIEFSVVLQRAPSVGKQPVMIKEQRVEILFRRFYASWPTQASRFGKKLK